MRFYGQPIRVAVIYSTEKDDSKNDFLVYDPLELIPNIKNQLSDYLKGIHFHKRDNFIIPITDRTVPGFIIIQSQRDAMCQIWLAERPRTASPIEFLVDRLELAMAYFHELTVDRDTAPAIKHEHFLSTGDAVMVRNYIRTGIFSRPESTDLIASEQLVDQLRKVAGLTEESNTADGFLAICEERPTKMELEFVKSVDITATKHVRKLLTPSDQGLYLTAHRTQVIGFARPEHLSGNRLIASFRDGKGRIILNGAKVCDFNGDRYFALKDESIERSILSQSISVPNAGALIDKLCGLIHTARSQRFGCTVVLTDRSFDGTMSGQTIQSSLLVNDISADLLCNLAAIDGALHINLTDMCLEAFACLLDGKALPDEDRSRGARYNSAMRFSDQYRSSVVIVVSEDGPTSIFCNGAECGDTKRLPDLFSVNNSPPRVIDVFGDIASATEN